MSERPSVTGSSGRKSNRFYPPDARHAATPAAACAALLLLTLYTVPLAARTQENSAEFEGYGGVYLPGPPVLTTEPAIGFRGGFNVKPEFNIQIDFMYVRSKTSIGVNTDVTVDLDYKVSYIAAPFAFQPLPYGRWVPMLYVGPGWAFIDAAVSTEAEIDEPIPDRLKEDSFFLVFGGGVRYFVNRNWYVRPDVRFRWLQRRDTDPIDSEILFAVGYNSL